MSRLMDVLLADSQRLERTGRLLEAPSGRADAIMDEGNRRRIAYSNSRVPQDHGPMAYGAQIGYLHAEIRRLVHELEAVTEPRRNPDLHYETVSIAEVAVPVLAGFSYTAGEPARITSAQCYSETGDPGDPGEPEELELSEVWINGAEVSGVLVASVLEDIEDALMAIIHAEPADE